MLRQLYDALRFAIAEFFDVPPLGVAAMLATVALLCAYASLRTNYFAFSYRWPGGIALLAVFIALGFARNNLRR